MAHLQISKTKLSGFLSKEFEYFFHHYGQNTGVVDCCKLHHGPIGTLFCDMLQIFHSFWGYLSTFWQLDEDSVSHSYLTWQMHVAVCFGCCSLYWQLDQENVSPANAKYLDCKDDTRYLKILYFQYLTKVFNRFNRQFFEPIAGYSINLLCNITVRTPSLYSELSAAWSCCKGC